MTYKIWYISPKAEQLASTVGFINPPSDVLKNVDDVVEVGDVIIQRSPLHSEWVLVSKLVDTRIKMPIIDPTLQLVNADWVKYMLEFSNVVGRLRTRNCDAYLKRVANSQSSLLHKRCYWIQPKATWVHTVKSGVTFMPHKLKHIEKLLLDDNDQLKPEYIARLINPRIKNLILVASTVPLTQFEIGEAWRHVKSILSDFDYKHEVNVWDSKIFGFVLSHYPLLTNEIISDWVSEKEEKDYEGAEDF